MRLIRAKAVTALQQSRRRAKVRTRDLAPRAVLKQGRAPIEERAQQVQSVRGLGREDAGTQKAVAVGLTLEFLSKAQALAARQIIGRVLGGHVDHPGQRARAVEGGRGRPAQDFDPLIKLRIGEKRTHAVLLVELGGAVHLDDQFGFIRGPKRADAADIEALAQHPVRADRLDAGQIGQGIAQSERLLAVEILLIHDRDRLRRVDGDLLLPGRDDHSFKLIGLLGPARAGQQQQAAKGNK